MLTKKIIEELKRKKNNELKKYQFIGAEIKSSRLKLSKTLDSIGNVSKSISYISKIENNKIIPNESSLRELCDALYITKTELDNMSKFDECILEALNCLYRVDQQKMIILYNQYSNFCNVRTDLMKGLYYLMFKNYEDLKKVISNLKKIESSLSIEDYLIYILLCLEDLIENGDVIQALRITNIILNTESATSVILKLFKMYNFKIKTSLGISRFDHEYEEMLKMHAVSCNLIQIRNTINMYSKLLIELRSEVITDEFINDLESNDLKCYAYCKKNDIINATKYYHKDIDMQYKMYYLFKNRDLDGIRDILKNYSSNDILIMGNCYKVQLEDTDEFLRRYLMDIVLPYLKKKGKINLLLEYYDILVTVNSRKAKYKDSGVFGQEIVQYLNDVTKELAENKLF